MIKLTFCLRRKPELSLEEFHRYWREEHGPLVVARAELLGVRKYQQVHTLVETELHAALQRRNGGAPEPFDGIAEIWVDNVDSFRNGSGLPGSRQAAKELLEDEARFIDLPNSPMWLGEEVVFVDNLAGGPLPHVRRIVTGHTPAGDATIVEDAPSPVEIRNPARPGFVLRNIWRTGETPASVDAPDSITEQQGLLPPAGGTILRVIDFPPEPTDPEILRQQLEAAFQAQYPDADHTGSNREQPHPGMHKTATVDYAIILQGTITAILDDVETQMQAGDILIQRGTNHAWSNRSGNPARIAFVLVDGVAEAE